MKKASVFRRFTDQEWEREFESDFTFLSRIPCSEVLQAVAVYRDKTSGYSEDDAKKLARGTLPRKRAGDFFAVCRRKEGVPYLLEAPRDQKTIIQNLYSAYHVTTDIGFTPEQWIEVLNRNNTSFQKLQQHFNELYSNPAAGASDVRKALFPRLSEKFSCKPAKQGGGEWAYALTIEKHAVNLSFDFGGMHPGFRAQLWLRRKKAFFDFSYLTMMGFRDTYWNMVRMQELSQACDVFVETLDRALTFCVAEDFWS